MKLSSPICESDRICSVGNLANWGGMAAAPAEPAAAAGTPPAFLLAGGMGGVSWAAEGGSVGKVTLGSEGSGYDTRMTEVCPFFSSS